ncbi:MAG: hypothetical protein EBW58_07620, partial [Betaproteobacteria bacterium]|nr:hypothetical protein [Betaproteobacteria bacterium]
LAQSPSTANVTAQPATQSATQPTLPQPAPNPQSGQNQQPSASPQPPASSQSPNPQPSGSGSAAASSATKGSIQRLSGDRLQLNFRDAEVETVAAAFAQLIGRSILVDARVKGRMSLESPRPLNKEQALALFQAALRLQLFAMVQVGDSLRVVPEVDAKLHGGPVQSSESPSPGSEAVVSRVFRLRYELANNILPIIRPLVPPNNTISAMASNNSLVVTDYASNLERIAQLIEELDAPAKSEFISIPIKHASASDVAGLVSRLLDASEVPPCLARVQADLHPRKAWGHRQVCKRVQALSDRAWARCKRVPQALAQAARQQLQGLVARAWPWVAGSHRSLAHQADRQARSAGSAGW